MTLAYDVTTYEQARKHFIVDSFLTHLRKYKDQIKVEESKEVRQTIVANTRQLIDTYNSASEEDFLNLIGVELKQLN